jgi:FkbM family methyltransferase
MAYCIPLPDGGRLADLDILEPNSTTVQRFIRSQGLGAYERSTSATVLALCELHDPGFVFFDIGANMGLYGALAASMFSPRMVHVFEPAPTAAAVARRIMAKNRLSAEVFESAVSDATGAAVLHLSPVSDASHSLVEGFREETDHLDVAMVRLDDHVERTGTRPDIVKIDVETHEPAVLRGASSTIAASRPAIVIEVLRRRGRDHGEEITALMEEFGYTYYELSASPTWEARTAISGSGTTDRDWLLLPDSLDPSFPAAWERWNRRLAACGPDRNPRPPILPTVRAALDRGGWREVIAAGRRHVDSMREGRSN